MLTHSSRLRVAISASPLWLALSLLWVAPARGQAPRTGSSAKKALTIDDYARWRSIEGSTISSDGNWVAWVYRFSNALDQRPALHLRRLDASSDQEIANAV